jgi:hypothetical protein
MPFYVLFTHRAHCKSVILHDLIAEFYGVGDLYTFSNKPPACVLSKLDRAQSVKFDQLPPLVMPIFPIERSISLRGVPVRR